MEISSLKADLPLHLYRAEQVRELDRVAIEVVGIPGFTLMQRAGEAAFAVLLAAYPRLASLAVFCGAGNNGGDGYVMATLALQQGIAVRVIQCGDADKINGDALKAKEQAVQGGVEIVYFSAELVIREEVIVDALLGTGLSGEVRGVANTAIAAINQSDGEVLAVDIPSGLCSDSGCVLGAAVRADHTVSFIGLKQGLLTASGPDYVGRLYFAGLSVPSEVYRQVPAAAERLDFTHLKRSLVVRQASAHKGQFGHVMVAGGDVGMAGAAAMASQAAARSGAGLVSCATRPEHVAALVSRCPEVMAHGVISGQEIEPLLERASVVVIGPGLGQGPWGEQLLQQVMALSVPLVVDADALNIIAAGRVVKKPYRDNWIITPHPGEAARLLGWSTAQVQEDRFAAVSQLQQRYGGAVILKGAGTLVTDGDNALTGLCPYGNPGMATGGMGDVLSGVLAALMAQGLSSAQAARLGVCLHACAGDMAAADGAIGMVATDLIAPLRQLVNQ